MTIQIALMSSSRTTRAIINCLEIVRINAIAAFILTKADSMTRPSTCIICWRIFTRMHEGTTGQKITINCWALTTTTYPRTASRSDTIPQKKMLNTNMLHVGLWLIASLMVSLFD